MTERQNAICSWAADHIEKRDFVIVDTETTGVEIGSEVVQVAVVNAWGKVAFASMTQPLNPINETGQAFEVHGISNAMLKDAPSIGEVQAVLLNHMGNAAYVIAYGAKFDRNMLTYSMQARLPFEWECLMEEYAEFWGEPGKYGRARWQRLGAACSQMGTETKPGHDAVSDALAAYDLLKSLAGKYTPEVI